MKKTLKILNYISGVILACGVVYFTMAITGVNKYTDTAGTKNTLEDYGVLGRGVILDEGILQGFRVRETDGAPSGNIIIEPGLVSIDAGGQFMVFRLDADESIALPNLNTTAKHYLIALKIDTNTPSQSIVALEGTAGTDPELTEAGSIYYLPLARVKKLAIDNNVTNEEIEYSYRLTFGATVENPQYFVTNNSTVEVIGQRQDKAWTPYTEAVTVTGTHTFTVARDREDLFQIGTKIQWIDDSVRDIGNGIGYGVVGTIDYNDTTKVTTVTLIDNDDCSLQAGTIINMSYSYGHPANFPRRFLYTATIDGLTTSTALVFWRPVTGKTIRLYGSISGTSNSTVFKATLPAGLVSNLDVDDDIIFRVENNGTFSTNPGRVAYTNGLPPTQLAFVRDIATATISTWTASNGKSVSFNIQLNMGGISEF